MMYFGFIGSTFGIYSDLSIRSNRCLGQIRYQMSMLHSEQHVALIREALKPLRKSIPKNKSIRTWSYVQFATVENGLPKVRTIVFRGFLNPRSSNTKSGSDSDSSAVNDNENLADGLVFCTDTRSRKVAALADNNKAEVAWYLPTTRDQFRISGDVSLIGGSGDVFNTVPERFKYRIQELMNERIGLWKRMNPPARAQFYWPGNPGEVLHPAWPGELSEKIAATAGDKDSDSDENPTIPDSFLLLILWPTSIDWLNLKTNHRFIDSQRVNP
uniref:Pyridoxamine 5'-phosphate oxidase Alr4036 family FMN-binding domain-containing protein n=1 Tax=Timspurckia oligopyrenoides TaxID=708627 RepID=A0A7S0ZKL5_9RHOD|mmetsp:Transcript_9019/g.16255  ORF Transcript_9019/g.16255 Transcript_9019/m.16255 type:complete len:271 (+) Transcript_9019:34-846(+)